MKKPLLMFFLSVGGILTTFDHVFAGIFVFIGMIVMVASLPKPQEGKERSDEMDDPQPEPSQPAQAGRSRHATLETRFNYDERRLLKDSRFYADKAFICTFSYDRLPDGTTERTLAIGPDGEVWAEYPGLHVVQVQKNGQPPGHTAGIIYKGGDWW